MENQSNTGLLGNLGTANVNVVLDRVSIIWLGVLVAGGIVAGTLLNALFKKAIG